MEVHVDIFMLYTNSRGRPRFFISQEQLEYHLQIGFTCPKIANVFGVSVSTITEKKDGECEFSVGSLYSIITDDELDVLVAQIQIDFPNCGYRLMHGQLLCRGHRVTQARIRAYVEWIQRELL